MGDWTIHVSDQNRAGVNGTFLGWQINFWGSAVDASKAFPWSKRPKADEDLPDPIFEDDPSAMTSTTTTTTTTTTIEASTTKQYTKPTDHLPSDHDEAEGESHKPAFPGTGPNVTVSATGALPSMTPTPDEGYFQNMTDLLSNSTWLFVGVGVIAALAMGGGWFFYRRRRRGYTSVQGDDEMAMSSMRGGGGEGTRKLYDALAEASDDEEDERAAFVGTGRSPVGLRYHDEFLEDDGEMETPKTGYRDEPPEVPTPPPMGPEGVRRSGAPSPESASESGGSWEVAQASSSEALNRTQP